MQSYRMKAAVWHGDMVSVDEVPIPEINSHEMLLQVTYTGLCKTDVKKIKGATLLTKGMLDPPRVFGHEIVGKIKKVGVGVKSYRKGDRVAVYHHVPCLDCYYCGTGDYVQCPTYRNVDTTAGIGKPSGGGFAEYVRVPQEVVERGIIRIPDGVDDKRAVFMEPTNCCYKGIEKSGLKGGESVAIFGQGPIGLTLNQIAKLRGANVIGVDLVDYRLEEARKKYGADHIVNAATGSLKEKIENLTDGRGVDKAIVAVEEPAAIYQAINSVRGGGTVVFFSEFGAETQQQNTLGQHIVDTVYGKELTVKGCYSSSYMDHQLAADLVFQGKIKTEEMISHIFDLYELEKAIHLADTRRHIDWAGRQLSEIPVQSLKILVKVA